MTDNLERAREELANAASQTAAHGLVGGSSGNLSLRIGDDILITPRRAKLHDVDPASCVRVRIADGEIVSGGEAGVQPSSETPMHLGAYRAGKIGAVVHTHSLYATTVATVFGELPPIHYLLAAFGGPVRVVPYAPFGSDELAETVCEALQDRKAALLQNHGAVVAAETLGRAVELAALLEWIAQLFVTARSIGTPALLDADELVRVAERSATLRYGLTGESE